MKIHKLKIIPLLLGVFALMLLTANFANAKDAEKTKPVKIAIIGDTEKHMMNLDMLTVKLSEDENIHILERSEWEKILEEQQLLHSNLGKNSSKIGKLLGADGLIILTEEEIKGKKYLYTKLLDVKRGIILDSITSPIGQTEDSFNLADSIEFRFKPKLSKLGSDGNKIVISMLNLRVPLASSEMLTIENELNTLFGYSLMQEQNVLLTERWNIADAVFEKNLEGKDSGSFKTGTVILDGTIELKNKENLEVNLFITNPDGAKQKLKVSGKIDELDKIAENLTAECLKVAKVAKKSVKWNPEKEGYEYFKEARWAYNAGLFVKADQSAESAWALGCRIPELSALRLKCYLNRACWSGAAGLFPNKKSIDFSRLDKHFDAAIMALEIYNQNFLTPVLQNKKIPPIIFSKYSDRKEWDRYGTWMLKCISALLQYSYQEKLLFKYPEKQAFLGRCLKDTATKLLAVSSNKKDLYLISMAYAPFWSSSTAETEQYYNQMLSLNASPSIKESIRFPLRRSKELPMFLDRSGKYNQDNEQELLEEYLKKLSTSGKLQQKLDALYIRIYQLSGIYFNGWNIFMLGGATKSQAAERDKVCAEIYKLYNEHKEQFWDSTLFLPPGIVEFLAEKDSSFAYEFLFGSLEVMLKKKEWQSNSALISCINNGIFTKEQRIKIEELLKKFLSFNRNLSKDNSFKKLKEALDKKYAQNSSGATTFSIKPLWNRDLHYSIERDFTPINGGLLQGEIFYHLSRKIDEENKTIQFIWGISSITTLKTESIKFQEIALNDIEFKEAGYGIEMSGMMSAINGDYLAFAAYKSVFIFNLQNKKCLKLNIPNQKYAGVLFCNNKLYAFFETMDFALAKECSSLNDSGVIEIDYKNDTYKIICSSRRNPAETVLDNIKPYSPIKPIMTLDRKYICFKAGSLGIYIYNTASMELKQLENMDDDFLKSYICAYSELPEGNSVKDKSKNKKKKKNRKKKNKQKGSDATRYLAIALGREDSDITYNYIRSSLADKFIQKLKALNIQNVAVEFKYAPPNTFILGKVFTFQFYHNKTLLKHHNGYLYYFDRFKNKLHALKMIDIYPIEYGVWTQKFMFFDYKDGILLVQDGINYENSTPTEYFYSKHILFYPNPNTSIQLKSSLFVEQGLSALDKLSDDNSPEFYKKVKEAVSKDAESGNVIAKIIYRQALYELNLTKELKKGAIKLAEGYEPLPYDIIDAETMLYGDDDEEDEKDESFAYEEKLPPEVKKKWMDLIIRKSKESSFFMSLLGSVYYSQKDMDKAFECWRKSLVVPSAHREYLVGLSFVHSYKNSDDVQQALKYLKMAVDHGSVFAAYQLGVLYSAHPLKYMSTDMKQAVKYYEIAVKGDHAAACRKLGMIYQKAGGTQNLKEAKSLFIKGGNLGDTWCKELFLKVRYD